MIRMFWLLSTFAMLSLVDRDLNAQQSQHEGAAAATPLANAHAHNDYEHPRPLLDALSHGFTSIEADIFLVDGQLLVAHDLDDVARERTFEKMYLQPLLQRATENGGRVYKGGPIITLLVDIKADGQIAYEALNKLLEEYDSLISVTQNGKSTEKAVTVIVSGDRPIRDIEESKVRRVGIDGRVSDLDSDKPSALLPLISDNWTKHFRYRGVGTMPVAEQEKLQDMVDRAHAKGRRIRFWATPENVSLWRELRNAGVDLIGTDDLEKLSEFLRAKS